MSLKQPLCLSGPSRGFLRVGTAVILGTGEKEEDPYLRRHLTYHHLHPPISPTDFQQPEHVSVCVTIKLAHLLITALI